MPNDMESVQSCDAVLVPNITVLHERLDVKYALLMLIDKSNYKEAQQQYKAIFPGYFDGEYDSFDKERTELFQQQNVNLQIYEARNLIQSVVPAEARAKWLECMISRGGAGLYATVNDVDDNAATLKVTWVPGPGTPILHKTEMTIENGEVAGLNTFTENDNFDGTTQLIIKRKEKDKAVRGVLNGLAGAQPGGNFSAKFYIPKMPELKVFNIDESPKAINQSLAEFLTPSVPVPTTLTVTVLARSAHQDDHQNIHWMQIYYWDGNSPNAKDLTGEIEVVDRSTPTELKRTVTIDVEAGVRKKIKFEHRNRGARATELSIHITGSYKMLV